MSDNKSFCYEIFKNISIWSYNNNIKYNPCSYYNGFTVETNNLDLSQVWRSMPHRKLMEQSQTGTAIPGCFRCYKEESSGLKSRRQGSFENYEIFLNDPDITLSGPTGIDYSVGNLCNLKCMICGPYNSSSWIGDFQKIYPDKNINKFKFNKDELSLLEQPEYLRHVKSIHFHGGGEPLLSNFHYRLLQKINEVKGLTDVRVFYNTNGTQRVNNEILEIWEKCRLVEIYFSIDDIEDRFNYQRTGANWNSVVQNIKWFESSMPHNHMFNINCTWSHLNFYYLPELVNWYQNNFQINRYGDPINLMFQEVIGNFKIKSLSNKSLDILKDRFLKYPMLLELLDSITVESSDHHEFWDYVDALDRIRGNSFRNICPEWSKILDEDSM